MKIFLKKLISFFLYKNIKKDYEVFVFKLSGIPASKVKSLKKM